MNDIVSQLTVMFEDPFWIGLYERRVGRRYEVCKITFGAEPKDYDIYAFMHDAQFDLRFSPAVSSESPTNHHINPKRMQRMISKQVASDRGIGTKAQQALKLQQEQSKQERKTRSRTRRDEEKQRQFELRQKKHKEKHRGH